MIKKTLICLMAITLSLGTVSFADGSFSNLEDLYADYYKHIKNRDASFTLYYSGKISDAKALISSMDSRILVNDPAAQVAITGWGYKQWTRRSTRLEITVDYNVTKAEEEAVRLALAPVVAALVGDKLTDYDKTLAIHNWILDHITYDDSLQKFGLKDAWDGNVVCQGYAALFQEMCQMANVQSRIVYGTLDGSRHAWNLVNINGGWYHVDCTNDDSHYNRLFYFLRSDAAMMQPALSYIWDQTLWPAATSDYAPSVTPVSSGITVVFN